MKRTLKTKTNTNKYVTRIAQKKCNDSQVANIGIVVSLQVRKGNKKIVASYMNIKNLINKQHERQIKVIFSQILSLMLPINSYLIFM